ncbi:MAG: hypothetical protein KH706_03055 [Faecalibacterium prausnitzii]|nr:hypothetical protein [Faecalibacterium prausnitzii]
MKMTMRQKYAGSKPVGVIPLSNWGGLEILDIESGCTDKIVAAFNFGEREQPHRYRQYENAEGRVFIKVGGVRYYLDEALRV